MAVEDNIVSTYEQSLGFEIPNTNQVTARMHVLGVLKEGIVRNRLVPGTWLSEEHLSSVLNVSRTPVREALLELHTNQLIERANNGRLYVKQLTVKEALDIYSVREVLEDLVITQASQNLTEVDLARLMMEVEKMRITDSGTVKGDVGDSGRNFHELLYSIANNDVTQDILQMIQPRFNRYRYFSTSTGKKRTSKAINEHEEIYLALRERDVNKARHLMREHINNSRQSVLQALQSK